MNAERFDQIKKTVVTTPKYNHCFSSVEHYHTYEEEDIAHVIECADITLDEAVQFLDEMVKRGVDEWYATQPPLSFPNAGWLGSR